ncbi:Transcriptional activator HlyU [Pontiella desulfatans]|uniref:Transcriptional activator HlyU n=1 Tax=Pontiella desulfatans TaxID=2750659 RepID=A0A6C2U389_PONDE|nr:metalloregulator ArsR/SmtB family transcription factor [Pontiella desulfatans]VGO14478.1 Transcriptional activator HlyU [Pontiella desulfatans]
MKPCNFEIFELQADLYQTMASPKRLAIVELLSHGEQCVGAIAETLDSSVSAISQHLRNMKDKNVVVTRKDAQTVYYRLKNPKIIEGCHLVREILLEEMEAQGRKARDYDEETVLTN